MEKIIVTEGTANQFRDFLQTSYDYLDNCDKAIDNCTLLDELGIENNNNALKVVIYKQRSNISTLLGNVSIFEENVLNIDTEKAKNIDTSIEVTDNSDLTNADIPTNTLDSGLLDVDASDKDSNKDSSNNQKVTVLSLDDEEDEIETIANSNSNSNNNSNNSNSNNNSNNSQKNSTITNNGGNNYYDGGNYSSYDDSSSENVDIEEEVSNNTSNYYEFSTDIQDMLDNGDAFANSPYSLTSYTNFLLYKYNIKDKTIAEKIYKAMLEYGKNYSLKNNGVNPILNIDEDVILIGLYDILKQEDNFDINNYSIFQNVKVNSL